MEKKYNFDLQNNMKGTESWKWDKEGAICKYPFGVADTDYIPPQEIIEALKQKIEQGNLAYGVLSEKFGESISLWFQKRHKATINKEWVRYSPGLITAIKLLMEAVTHQGENIIIQTPVYFNFSLIIERNGRKLLENELIYKDGKYEIDFDDLEKKASDPRTTMMILCNPHNPIGHEWSREELEKIADICNRNNVFVISDEVHSDILYENTKHTSFVTLDDKTAQNSATIASPGKTFNINGLYVSYAIIPNSKVRTGYEITYSNHHFDFSILGVQALIAAYTHGDRYTDELIEYLENNKRYLKEFLEKNVPEVKMVEANATYLMWLDFRAWNMTGNEIDKILRLAGISLNNGSIYGKAGERFMRFNIACSHKVLREALEELLITYKKIFKK